MGYTEESGENRNFDKKEIDLDLNNIDKNKPLSLQRKLFFIIVFILGVYLSNGTFILLAIPCDVILLFQKNKKVNVLGFILLIIQTILISFYWFIL